MLHTCGTPDPCVVLAKANTQKDCIRVPELFIFGFHTEEKQREGREPPASRLFSLLSMTDHLHE